MNYVLIYKTQELPWNITINGSETWSHKIPANINKSPTTKEITSEYLKRILQNPITDIWSQEFTINVWRILARSDYGWPVPKSRDPRLNFLTSIFFCYIPIYQCIIIDNGLSDRLIRIYPWWMMYPENYPLSGFGLNEIASLRKCQSCYTKRFNKYFLLILFLIVVTWF
jgi:hypothetical protein